MSSSSQVRALAHPLRARLHTRLRQAGPATATELAAWAGTNSGATSYHLRQLAAAGLVQDDESSTGRQRRWRALPLSPVAVEEAPDADDASSLAWLERDVLAHFADQVQRWTDQAETWPAGWADRCTGRDFSVLVTDDQLGALQHEVAEVVERYRRVGQGNPSARRVAVYLWPFPLDPERPPAPRRR